ncbi:MAG: hypothetical protein HY796_02080 [Elusimicrobia bacterium]|nr:hypothetical protein [Elusimicrobiota bacterium]
MGDAFTAMPDEPLGIYYNPAGIVFLRRQALSLAHHIYLQDISGNSLAFVSPFKNWAVGLAPAFFSMKEEPVYDSLGNDTGDEFTYKKTIIPIAAAYRLGNWGLGLALKSYSEEIGGDSSGTAAFDVGAIYRLAALRFGFSAQNYGGKIYGYDVAKIQRLGAAYLPAGQAGAGGKYLFAADIKREGEAGTSLSIGSAVSLMDMVKIRCGWRFKEEFGGLTFGLGLERGGLSFDYAFLSYGDFGITHKAGISLAFGPNAEERAKLKTFLGRVGEATGITPEKITQVRTLKITAETSAALAEFTGKNVPGAGVSAVIGNLRAALADTGLFKVMDKNTMDTTLDEQKFRSSGRAALECAVEMGRLLNVRMVFTGALSKDEDGYNIRVDAVDIKTGKIAAFYETKALSDLDLKEVCPKIVKKMFSLK